MGQQQVIHRSTGNWPWVRRAGRRRYWIAAPAAVAVALLIYRVGEPRPSPEPEPLAARTAALDTHTLIALRELLQTLIPPDGYVPPMWTGDEELLAALALGDLVGVTVSSPMPRAADLSDMELEGIGNLAGGLD